MAARIGGQYFVGPDNGLFTPFLFDASASLHTDPEPGASAPVFIHLDRPEYWLPNVSHTFHGRDIFAPAAAHLAAGVPLERLGTSFADPVRIPLPQPERMKNGWRTHVTTIDAFGNLTTDMPASRLESLNGLRIRIAGREIDGLSASYGQRSPGDLVALVDSEGYVEVAVVNGSAANVLGAKLGDVVEVILS